MRRILITAGELSIFKLDMAALFLLGLAIVLALIFGYPPS